jgi:hypothetical protein
MDVDAVAARVQEPKEDQEGRQKLVLTCPLCRAPMEISRGVFVRVVCIVDMWICIRPASFRRYTQSRTSLGA